MLKVIASNPKFYRQLFSDITSELKISLLPYYHKIISQQIERAKCPEPKQQIYSSRRHLICSRLEKGLS